VTTNAHPIRTRTRILPVAVRLTIANATMDFIRRHMPIFALIYRWISTLVFKHEKGLCSVEINFPHQAEKIFVKVMIARIKNIFVKKKRRKKFIREINELNTYKKNKIRL
jgi:hypothetical protein